MKKTAVLLSLILLLGAVVPFGAVAEAGNAAALSDSLVRHYDFYHVVSGTRPKDVTESGNGTKYSLYPSNATTENGLGCVKGADTRSYYSNGDKDDLTALSELTLFMAFRYDGTATSDFAYALQMTGLLNVIIDENGLLIRTNDGKWLNGTDGQQNTKHPVKPGDEIWLAASLAWSKDLSSLNSTVLVSNDNGRTFTTYERSGIVTAANPKNFAKLVLGKSKAGVNGILDFWFDDFRIYGKALTADEIKGITLDATPTVVPANVQAQTRVDTGEKTFDVRFCAVLDSLDYSEVGFDIVAKDASGQELKKARFATAEVYESVLALGTPVTAGELGGTYLIAYKITEIPEAVGAVTFEITAYAVRNGVTWHGQTGTVIYRYADLAAN